MSFQSILTISLTLFAVIDILGSIPVILTLREKLGHIESGKATISAGVLMITFLFIGQEFLNVLGVDIKSFALAGSIVIFIIALEMVLGQNFFKDSPDDDKGSIVPIAFPIVAGAGTLTTIISLSSEYQKLEILIAILINLAVIFMVLKSTSFLSRKLGKRGQAVLRKFFGLILLSIAIKLFKSNM
jgi:multiple antibiotic resistance protein